MKLGSDHFFFGPSIFFFLLGNLLLQIGDAVNFHVQCSSFKTCDVCAKYACDVGLAGKLTDGNSIVTFKTGCLEDFSDDEECEKFKGSDNITEQFQWNMGYYDGEVYFVSGCQGNIAGEKCINDLHNKWLADAKNQSSQWKKPAIDLFGNKVKPAIKLDPWAKSGGIPFNHSSFAFTQFSEFQHEYFYDIIHIDSSSLKIGPHSVAIIIIFGGILARFFFS